MLRFIKEHLDLCGNVSACTLAQQNANPAIVQWKNKLVRDLKSVTGSVVAVNTNAHALHAFLQMHTHGVSAVAVIDNQGILVGSISIRYLFSANAKIHHRC